MSSDRETNTDRIKRLMTRDPVILSFHPLYKIFKPKPNKENDQNDKEP